MSTLVVACIISVLGSPLVRGRPSTLVATATVGEPRRTAVDTPPVISIVDTAAETASIAALDTLLKLVNAGNYRALGFDSLSDTTAAARGDPLVIYYVRLDSLRVYHAGKDPQLLLDGGDRVLYPVLVRGQTLSSFTLARDAAGWKGVSYGDPKKSKLVWGVLHNSSPMERYFLVEVLALGVDFLGFETSGKLMLVPLLDDRKLRWTAGVPLLAENVFAKLVVDAMAYNGLPR